MSSIFVPDVSVRPPPGEDAALAEEAEGKPNHPLLVCRAPLQAEFSVRGVVFLRWSVFRVREVLAGIIDSSARAGLPIEARSGIRTRSSARTVKAVHIAGHT